jgi:hypothetical protein
MPTKSSSEPIEEVVDQNCEVRSIAMSLDDDFVALGSDRELYIYDVTNRRLLPTGSKFSIGPNLHVTSQRVNFSPNGEQVVIATRQSDGHIRTILYDRLKLHETWNRITAKAVGMVSTKVLLAGENRSIVWLMRSTDTQ